MSYYISERRKPWRTQLLLYELKVDWCKETVLTLFLEARNVKKLKNFIGVDMALVDEKVFLYHF